MAIQREAPAGVRLMAVTPRRFGATAGVVIAIGIAAAIRRLASGSASAASPVGAVSFVVLAAVLVVSGRWRPERPRLPGVAIGVIGAVGLLLAPAVRDVAWHIPPDPVGSVLLWWLPLVSLVAVSEEVLLRGLLFDTVRRTGGVGTAVVLSTVVFAAIHVPLYGWGSVPLNLAAGLWLSGMRMAGGLEAAVAAHWLADVAAGFQL